MDKKVALVTGVSSDIGREIVLTLAGNGMNIAAQYYKNDDRARMALDDPRSKDAKIEFFDCDLRGPVDCQNLVEKVVDDFGKINILINTVGPFFYRNILDVTPEQWKDCIDLNLNTAFNLIFHALPVLENNTGHIINFAFSGSQNLKSWTMSTDYGVAKAGIVVMTKSLATALASRGIRVNAVCPGLIETSEITEEERKRMEDQIPLGRAGRPEEVAEVVRWLVMDSPQYVTGALIPVAGAWEF